MVCHIHGMRKPKALKPGHTVGLLSVSNPVTDEERETCVRAVEEMGYRTVCGQSLYHRNGYLAGPDDVRSGDVNRFFADSAIDAIFCVRGGQGANRLPPLIDLDTVRRNPKIFLGYSDVTAMHVMFGCYGGMCSFHGPMPHTEFHSPSFPGYVRDSLVQALTSTQAAGEVAVPSGDEPIRGIAPGVATGRLVGGCLSLVSALMGTPWEIDTHGAVLVFEDVREQPYKYDRWLCQLRDAGKLEDLAAVAIGQCTDCVEKRAAMDLPLTQIWEDLLIPLGVPVITGVPLGHGERKMTFPLGAQVLIDGTEGRMVLLESGVS